MSLLEWISPDADLTLDGAGVRLRPPRRSDYAQWSAIRRISRGFLQPWEPAWAADELTPAAFARRLYAWRRGRELDHTYAFFVFRQPDDILVGGVTLNNVRRGVAQMGTLGYWAGQPFARRGHTLAAVRAVTRFAFGPLALHRLEAACLPSNEASRRLLEKAGFSEEGLAKAYLKINGEWRDHVLFGMVSRDGAQGPPWEGLPG